MFFRHNLPALSWALLIFALTLMPGRYIPPVNIWDLANIDKVVHLVLFFVLMILTTCGFARQYRFHQLRLHSIVTAFCLCITYGLLLEIIQGTILTDRHFDLFDAMANSIGCVLGIIIFKFVPIKF